MKPITYSVILALASMAQITTSMANPMSTSTQSESYEIAYDLALEPSSTTENGAEVVILQPLDAELDGSEIVNNSISLKQGIAKWNFEVPNDGNYTFQFDYSSPYGNKTNTFYVGEQAEKHTTPQSSDTETITMNLHLEAGHVELGVNGNNGNWGYIFITQVRIINHDSGDTPPIDDDYPGTHVTDSSKHNYADYVGTIPNVASEYYINQEDQTHIVGSYSNIYSKNLYDTGYGEDVGIAWAGWNPQHYLGNKAHKMRLIDEYNIKRLSFIPTYFIANYAQGVRCNDPRNTLTESQQVSLLTELIDKGIRINYRPHIDPIKFSWEGNSSNQHPGDLDWRGLFDQLDPMGGGYKCVIDKGLRILKQVVTQADVQLKEPIRFDLGAELMSSTKSFPGQWVQLAHYVRQQVDEDSILRDNIVLSHNFSHHIQYLVELEGHAEYFSRIVSGDSFEDYPQLLFVDDMTTSQRQNLAEYIKALDTITVSQYMPMDIINPITNPNTKDIAITPTDVKDALVIHEQNFIQKVLMGKLGIKKEELPVFHLGEYGMGIKGLITPNVWDSNAVAADEKISYEVHQKHAEIALKVLLEYRQAPETAAKSLMIWVSGAPYDVINFYKGDGQGMDIGDAGHGYPGKSPFNPDAADALKQYWHH